MVAAFFIHTILPGQCKILYHKIFGPLFSPQSSVLSESNSDFLKVKLDDAYSTIDARSASVDLMLAVATEVQSQYSLNRRIAEASYESDLERLHENGLQPNLEMGVLRLSSCLPCDFERESVVNASDHNVNFLAHASPGLKDAVIMWFGAINCCFTVILEKTENRMIADKVVRAMIKLMHSNCQVFSRPSDIKAEPEKIELIVDQYIPGGVLLFTNHRLMRQIEKDLVDKVKSCV